MVTRPCYLYIPRSGEPVLLGHHVDAGKFYGMEDQLVVYRNRRSVVDELSKLLPTGGTVAMEYSPLGALPRASKVDAGTVELIRSLGVQVTSSADLVQHTTQRWNEVQLASHQRAADKLGGHSAAGLRVCWSTPGRGPHRIPGCGVHPAPVR